jgi:hypothetical protein
MYNQLGGYIVFSGERYQRGYGLGGYFTKFYKWLMPLAEKHALPHLKSGFHAIKNQALDTMANVAKDAVAGKNVRDTVQEHVSQAIDNLKQKAERKLQGEGVKRRKKILFKRRKKDIFD